LQQRDKYPNDRTGKLVTLYSLAANAIMNLALKNLFDKTMLQTAQVFSIVIGQPANKKGIDGGLNTIYQLSPGRYTQVWHAS
jgi:hypothetical protein